MFRTGTRIMLITNPARTGVVGYERDGFVLVRWDYGNSSLLWGAEVMLIEESA